MVKNNPLYLIDGFAIIFKNYYAMMRNPLTNLRGENISALLGFVKQVQQVLRHAQERGSQHVVMILDSPGPTFRHKMYPEYKANRDEAPADLKVQIGYLAKLLQLWGIPTYKSPDYEADDLIATLARRASAEGCDCYVVTGDKDLYQLIDQHTSILKLDKGRIEQHRETYAIEKWGVRPDQICDYLALVGDSADNIPGVKGIGPKGAAKLLANYHNLEGIYSHIAKVQPDGIRKKLEESRDNAFLSYQLVTLAEQVPELWQPTWEQLWPQLQAPPTVYSGKGGQSNPGFANFLAELGLNKLAQEFGGTELSNSHLEEPNPDPVGQDDPATGNSLLTLQSLALTPPRLRNQRLPLQEITQARAEIPAAATVWPTSEAVRQSYECIRSEAQLQRWCEQITSQKIVAIDTETTGLNELADQLVGISLATATNCAAYIPLLHNPEEAEELKGNVKPLLSSEVVRRTLAECLTPEIKIIGQNFKFDYKVLANWGLKVPTVYFDTMIAAWLLDSLHPVGMDALAERYLGLEPIHFKDMLPKAKKGETPKTFADVPLEQAVHYAAEDADITWQLYECFAPLLAEKGLDTLFFELEMPLLPILGEMELRGIGCNRAELESYGAELESELAKLETTVKTLTGASFNLNSTQQLADVLFEVLKLPSGKKTKTGYSTDNSILEKLLHRHPVIAPLLEYRRLNKLHSTYVKSLPEMILPKTGRIHTHFSVTGAETGRLACKDPNLQNIPIRDAAGRRIRNAFQPKAGWGFFSADYSQIELVVLAHLSADPGLCQAFRSGRDIHQQTASQLFYLPMEKVNAEQRRIAKSINFGVIYGMSAFRLSQDLGLTQNDAKNFIEAYFREFAGVKSFISQTVALAQEQGFVETIAGRRRKIRQLDSNNKNEHHHGQRMAVNTVVQGSAADIVKRAMILLDAELTNKGWQSQLLLQVHDELIFESPVDEKKQLETLVPDVMENAYQLEVPLKVNGEWSTTSWGDLH